MMNKKIICPAQRNCPIFKTAKEKTEILNVRILIAEDGELTSLSIRRHLEKMGLKNITQTYSLSETIKVLEQENYCYDFIVLDSKFREYEPRGHTIIPLIKKNNPNVFILGFSASDKYNELMLLAGADYVKEKTGYSFCKCLLNL